MKNQRGEVAIFLLLWAFVICLVLFGIGGCMWVWPKYNVYAKEMSGKAVLVEAESSRQVAVLEAQATRDSAKYKADAEVERAKGVAQANEIIGNSLKGNSEYLRYLYIDTLHNTKNQIIYVPTEAGLPILEASRTAPQPVSPAAQ